MPAGKGTIKHEGAKYGWEFVFLGANIDAVGTAKSFGIAADRAVDYVPDAKGTELNFQMMSEAVDTFRQSQVMPQAPFIFEKLREI